MFKTLTVFRDIWWLSAEMKFASTKSVHNKGQSDERLYSTSFTIKRLCWNTRLKIRLVHSPRGVKVGCGVVHKPISARAVTLQSDRPPTGHCLSARSFSNSISLFVLQKRYLAYDIILGLLQINFSISISIMTSLEANIRRALDILLPKIKAHHAVSSEPIILGITGLQGSGKSTWASKIVEILSFENDLHTITISLDDLYKTHNDLIAQRDRDPSNKLYRTRGQPGTHDEQLGSKFFADLKAYRGEGSLKIPSFDKSLFNGEGDRAPESSWPTITKKPDVVVFEGWCVGFQPLPANAIEEKYALALSGKLAVNTPAQHQLSHLLEVNANLQRYCDAFMGPKHFNFFVHIDTDDLRNVYAWRLQQEHKMIEVKGSGMSDDQVKAFVDGYMPSYEVYLDTLRGGLFEDEGRMVRVVLDEERGIKKVEEL